MKAETKKQEEKKDIGYYNTIPKKETLKEVAEKFSEGVYGVIVKEIETLTPKEKAQELVSRYDVLQTFIENFNQQHAKECALIAADEMIEQQEYQNFHMMWSCVLYWKEVKKEINNL